MSDSEEPFGYVAFRRDEQKRTKSCLVTFNRESLNAWKVKGSNGSAPSGPNPKDEPSNPEGNGQTTEESDDRATPEHLLSRFLKAMDSATGTIGLTSITGQMFLNMFMEGALLPHARKRLYLAEQDDKIG